MKIVNLKIINLEWLLMHDHINIYIPILLFDEEHFKKRIRCLTIFWKKMSVFNFFKIIKKNIFRCRQIFFQNIARNLILFLKRSSSKSRIGMCMLWYDHVIITIPNWGFSNWWFSSFLRYQFEGDVFEGSNFTFYITILPFVEIYFKQRIRFLSTFWKIPFINQVDTFQTPCPRGFSEPISKLKLFLVFKQPKYQ